jgi:hypothetical protein
MRRSPGWFREALNSGELARAAQGAPSWNEVARRLGVSSDALLGAKVRAINAGAFVPTLGELQRSTTNNLAGPSSKLADGHTQIGDADTQGGYQDVDNLIDGAIQGGDSLFANGERWPNLDAFDAEWAHQAAPDGFNVKGVSTLYDAEGNVKQQWVKTRRESDPIADILVAFESIKDELPRVEVAQPAPVRCNEKQLATYLLGDCHVGMRAWRGDAGANFDLDIAERNLTELTGHLVDLAPSAQHALLINIGDFFHADSRTNTTTKGTPVDVDGRWSKVLSVGIRIMRRIIDRALQKHEHVTVINEIGNHDTHASVFLSLALAQFYENEPRVHIDTSPRSVHYYRFGKVLIATHHGHLIKPADLLGVMVCDRPEDWGETLYRYFFTGHIHHERSREFPGMLWRSLRSPASSDAWHDSMGYRSGHELSVEIFDAERGLVNRHIVGVPKNLGAAA